MSQSMALDSGSQYVTMGIDGEVFAVEVAAVRNILDMRPMVRLPNAPPFVLGMIDVRGRGVPVLDLRVRLGLPRVAANEHTRIVVLEVEAAGRPLSMGLLADRVFEVTALSGGGMEPPPDVGVRWRSDYIRGIGRRGDQFVIVFDMDHLLADGEAALLCGEVA